MDGDRHWATTLIRGSQPKQNRCRELRIKAKEDWYYPMSSFKFCWGPVGDALARAMPYEMLVPRCECVLQRVNCHFIRALCAPSVLSCGSCRMVMDSGHLHTVMSSFPEIFVEGPLSRSMLVSHSAMSRYKLVCFCLPCTLCFLSLCTCKEVGD